MATSFKIVPSGPLEKGERATVWRKVRNASHGSEDAAIAISCRSPQLERRVRSTTRSRQAWSEQQSRDRREQRASEWPVHARDSHFTVIDRHAGRLFLDRERLTIVEHHQVFFRVGNPGRGVVSLRPSDRSSGTARACHTWEDRPDSSWPRNSGSPPWLAQLPEQRHNASSASGRHRRSPGSRERSVKLSVRISPT